jgi:stage II sporulation protein GA (sporulation sigma-E factor processing peptidase)
MYAEVMIILNALINYCLLSFTNKMGTFQQKKVRLWVSAFTGGILIVLLGGGLLSIIGTFICMIVMAFGFNRSNWLLAASNCIIAALFAGGLLTVIQPWLKLANLYIVFAILIVALFGSLSGVYRNWFRINLKGVKEMYRNKVKLMLFGQEITLESYTDTGNQCMESLSGKPVHFVSSNKLLSVIPPKLWSFLNEFDGSDPTQITEVPKEFQQDVRLIRIATVQSENTWAVGIKMDQIIMIQETECALPPCYIVLTKNSRHFPRQTEAILHASTLFVQQSRGVMLCS